jgi:hypothetical protein
VVLAKADIMQERRVITAPMGLGRGAEVVVAQTVWAVMVAKGRLYLHIEHLEEVDRQLMEGWYHE